MTFKKTVFLTIIISVTSLLFLRSDLQASSRETIPEGIKIKVYRGPRSNVYSIGDGYVFFYEDQPITFQIVCQDISTNIINLGRDNWYDAISYFYVVPRRIVNGKLIREPEEERKVNYKIIKSEDLIDGKLKPSERKSVIVEVLGEHGQLLEENYRYSFYVKLSFDNYLLSREIASYWIERVTTSKEHEISWTFGKALNAKRDGKFEESANHYQKLLEIGDTLTKNDRAPALYTGPKGILRDLADAYVKAGNYTKAKEAMNQTLDYENQDIENRISRAREKARGKGLEFNREDYIKSVKKRNRYNKIIKDEMYSAYSKVRSPYISPYYKREAINYMIKKFETMETADNYVKAKEYKKAKEILTKELSRYNNFLEKRLTHEKERAKKESIKFDTGKFLKRDKRSFYNPRILIAITPKNHLPLTPYDERDIIIERIKKVDELMKEE